MTDSYYIELLKQLAESIDPVRFRFRVAACLVYKGKIISFGTGHLKSHPFQKRWASNEDSIFWHAEVETIYRASKVIELKDFEKSTLYVVRVKKIAESLY